MESCGYRNIKVPLEQMKHRFLGQIGSNTRLIAGYKFQQIHTNINNMDATQVKRMTNQAIQPQHNNPDIASLSTIGMRIRKAVADGYNVPGKEYDGYNAYDKIGYGHNDSRAEVRPQLIGTFGGAQENRGAQGGGRVPLPAHMEQPPALVAGGSTIGTCSNLSEWESNYGRGPQITTIESVDNGGKGKRKFDDIEEVENGYSGSAVQDAGPEYFQHKYGELKFNEEF